MTLQRLIEMVAPPSMPLYPCGEATWRKLQSEVGGILPPELYEYSHTYGSGRFDSSTSNLTIFNPGDPEYTSNELCYRLVYSELRDEYPEYYPYEVYPTKGGVYSFGVGTGAKLYMIPASPENEFKVVFDDLSTEHREFPGMSCMEFLYEFLCNRLYPVPYFKGKLHFVPQQLFPQPC